MYQCSFIGLPISFGRPMVFDSLFQKMSQNLPVYLQRYPHLPPQNETASMVPNLKPPSLPKMKLPIGCPIWTPLLPKMKLPIGCPIWNPLKHEYYRFLSIHVYSNLPKIGRQCTPPPQEWNSWIQVKVTFCFWLMYPPQEWKSWIQVKVTF